jgi:nitrogen regulatory protein PII
MKMLQIICDSGFEDYLLENFEKEGIKYFTKIEKALGKGSSSEPHLDSHIWPGFHVLYFVAVQDEKYDKIKKLLLKMKKELKGRGFKVFVYDIFEEI